MQTRMQTDAIDSLPYVVPSSERLTARMLRNEGEALHNVLFSARHPVNVRVAS